VEEGLHADAEGLVVTVDGGPVRGLASAAGAADAGDDWRDDVVAQREQGGDGAGRVGRMAAGELADLTRLDTKLKAMKAPAGRGQPPHRDDAPEASTWSAPPDERR
jgi:hypothetical protein